MQATVASPCTTSRLPGDGMDGVAVHKHAVGRKPRIGHGVGHGAPEGLCHAHAIDIGCRHLPKADGDWRARQSPRPKSSRRAADSFLESLSPQMIGSSEETDRAHHKRSRHRAAADLVDSHHNRRTTEVAHGGVHPPYPLALALLLSMATLRALARLAHLRSRVVCIAGHKRGNLSKEALASSPAICEAEDDVCWFAMGPLPERADDAEKKGPPLRTAQTEQRGWRLALLGMRAALPTRSRSSKSLARRTRP